jgi:hypothetical protein
MHLNCFKVAQNKFSRCVAFLGLGSVAVISFSTGFGATAQLSGQGAVVGEFTT